MDWGETRKDGLQILCSKQTLCQHRNGVTDWSILQLSTDHLLVCGESDRNSHASQLITNNNEPSGNRLDTKTFKDILQRETAENLKEFKAILLDLKKV